MSKPITRYMEQAIVNLSKAIKENDPNLTWAVLFNLEETITSYVDKAWQIKDKYNNKEGKK